MTINEMAVEMNVGSENLGWWLKSVAAYMQDGLTIEQAVARVHKLCNAILSQMQLTESAQAPEFKAWKKKLCDDVYDTINAQAGMQ
jgi:hypothetical protein